MNKILDILKSFGLSKDISDIKLINSGHINSTYKIIYSDGKSYILQRINKSVFKSPEKIMSNIKNLCKYFENLSYFPQFLSAHGKNYIINQNEIWRIYGYIDNSVSYDSLDDILKIYEFGRILGNFHKATKNADPSDFYITIENFHNTAFHIKRLIKSADNRYTEHFNFFYDILEYVKKLQSKKLPFHVTHNDVKCSNVLFDATNGKGLTLIDFDTVMPGLQVYDFGDGARSACINDNKIDIKKLDAYCKGYFSVTGSYREEDYYLGMLCVSAELSARYFYDYLNNENYFAGKSSGEKLERSSELIKISKSIIDNKEEIMSVIKNHLQ